MLLARLTIVIVFGLASVSLVRAEKVTFCLKGSDPSSKQVCFVGHQEATNLSPDKLEAQRRELRFQLEQRIADARAGWRRSKDAHSARGISQF
jgi:hypothetical protein